MLIDFKCFPLPIYKALWIASVFEMCYINKAALPFHQHTTNKLSCSGKHCGCTVSGVNWTTTMFFFLWCQTFWYWVSQSYFALRKILNSNSKLIYHPVPVIDDCNVHGTGNSHYVKNIVQHESELGQFCSKGANGGVQWAEWKVDTYPLQPLTGPFIILWWNWVKQLSLFAARTDERRGLFSQSLSLK